jgi:hypothetical protein
MELSPKEKGHIIAEEKLRYETVQGLQSQGGGKNCGSKYHACCHGGAFWKGLIIGLVLASMFSLCFREHYGRYHGDHCYYSAPMSSDTVPAGKTK